MGKIFNKEIVEILKAKNLNRYSRNHGTNLEIGDFENIETLARPLKSLSPGEILKVDDFANDASIPKPNKYLTSGGIVKKGKSYLILGDKRFCMQLKKHIGDFTKPKEKQNSICNSKIPIKNYISNRQYSHSYPSVAIKALTAKESEYAKNFKRFRNFLKGFETTNKKESHIKCSPSILGPFADEPIVTFLDRLVYCLILLMNSLFVILEL